MGRMRPDFLRGGIVREFHMIAHREVDRELFLEREKEQSGMNRSRGELGSLLKLTSAKHDEKEEARNRLSYLSVFATSGIVFFETKLGAGAYNSGEKLAFFDMDMATKIFFGKAGCEFPFRPGLLMAGNRSIGAPFLNRLQVMNQSYFSIARRTRWSHMGVTLSTRGEIEPRGGISTHNR